MSPSAGTVRLSACLLVIHSLFPGCTTMTSAAWPRDYLRASAVQVPKIMGRRTSGDARDGRMYPPAPMRRMITDTEEVYIADGSG
jgi:hypothetical protein